MEPHIESATFTKINKIVLGAAHRAAILDVIYDAPVVTASMIEQLTKINGKTVRHNLQRLAEERPRLILIQKRGWGEEYLYRRKGLKPVKQVGHTLAISTAWIHIQLATKQIDGVRAKATDPRKFSSSHGMWVPDWVFFLEKEQRRKFFAWEEETGHNKELLDFKPKCEKAWWWRKEHCYDTNGENPWKMKTITMLVSCWTEQHMEEYRRVAFSVRPLPEMAPSDMFYFTSRERWWGKEGTTLLTQPIWVTPSNDRLRSLVE